MQRIFLQVLVPSVSATESVPVPDSALLEAIATILIPATTEKFVASEKFVLNYGYKAKPGVRISFLGDNFKEWFLGKIEEPMAEITLRYAKLLTASLDDSIRAEIGTEYEETALTHIFALVERQLNSKAGPLLTNQWNVFYMLDALGVLRAVHVRWHGGGWRVDANSVDYPSRWHEGYRFFFRNCCISRA